MNKGLFITFEGCDGCGKTSVIQALSLELQKTGITPLITREPGGSVIAEEIRNIILDRKNTMMDPRTEALLYAASRRQHLAEIVLPALREGRLVISDRYLDSSLAYQGYARSIGIDAVYSINAFAIDDTMPDITFFLDVRPEIALRRIAQNRDESEINRLDLEKLEFHNKVYDAYLLLLKKFPERIIRIDASRSIEEEVEEIKGIISHKMKTC